MNFERAAIESRLLPRLLSPPPNSVPENVIPGLDCQFQGGLTPSDELRSTRAPSLANTDPRLLANDVHVIDDRVLEGWFPPEQEEPA